MRWLGGALWLDHPQGGVLVDAPVGVHHALAEVEAWPHLHAVVLSHDGMDALGGLLGVLDACSRAPDAPDRLQLVHPTHTERAGLLAGTWTRGWPHGVQLDIDGAYPGHPVGLAGAGTATFATLPLLEGVRGGAQVPVAGGGVVVELEGVRIAWAPPGRHDHEALRRLCRHADLAVICQRSGPVPEGARLGVRHLWTVGPDGQVHDHADLSH